MDQHLANAGKKFRIYSVHLNPAVSEALYKKGYTDVHIGGGITGDIQTNDTARHHRLKAIYHEKEQELMLAKLHAHPGKVPSLSRDDEDHEQCLSGVHG